MEDLIKREDAIKYCKLKADHYRKRLARIEAQGDAISYDPTEQINGFKDEIAIYESFVKELEDIPSAEPKQGEWLFVGNSIEAEWECSECGEKEFGSKSSLTNFCPNCGADMRKGANDENNQRMDQGDGSGR